MHSCAAVAIVIINAIIDAIIPVIIDVIIDVITDVITDDSIVITIGPVVTIIAKIIFILNLRGKPVVIETAKSVITSIIRQKKEIL